MEFSPRPAGGGYKMATYASSSCASDLVAHSKLAAHVLKRGGRTSGEWNARFVVLRPAVALLYFDSESDPVERAKGVMLLDDAAAMDIASDGEGGSPVVVLRPSPGDPDARSLFFRVASASEAREWQQALQACRLSSALGLCAEAERRLDVSRAETGALHGSLSAYKGALQEREDELEALNGELEAQREAMDEHLEREQLLRAGVAERAHAEGLALAGSVEALARVTEALAQGNASAQEFLASCSIGGVQLGAGSGSGSAALQQQPARRRAQTEALRSGSLLPSAAAAAAMEEAAATPASHSSLSRAPSLPSLARARAEHPPPGAAADALRACQASLSAMAAVGLQHSALVDGLHELAGAVDAAGAVSARARTAYKALRARALEVGRIVGRLEAAGRAKVVEDKAREAGWLAKERQWAGVVQALSVRLGREKERVGNLAELLKVKQAEAAAAVAAAAAAAAAAATAAAAGTARTGIVGREGESPLTLPQTRSRAPSHASAASGSGAGGGGGSRGSGSSGNTSGAGAMVSMPVGLQGLRARSESGSGGGDGGGGAPTTPHLVAATAQFAAGFVTPKKSTGAEEGPSSSSSSNSSSSSAGSALAAPAGNGGGETDLERAFGALQSVYEVSSKGAGAGSAAGAAEEELDDEHNPFGGPPKEVDNPFASAPTAAPKAEVAALATPKPQQQPQQQPLQQQPTRTPLALSPQQQQLQTLSQPQPPRVTPTATTRQGQGRAITSSSDTAISIAHLTGGAAEHSAIRRAAEGALAGVGAKAFNIMGGLIKKAAASGPAGAGGAGGGGAGAPPLPLPFAPSALSASGASASASASAAGGMGAIPVLSDPRQGRLYAMVLGVKCLPEYSINKTPLRPGLVVRASTVSSAGSGGDERSSPVMTIVDVGRARSLCAAINSMYAFKTTSISSVGVRLEIWTVGNILGGHKVGSIVIDVSRLADDPGQPYALWAPIITAEAEAAGEFTGPMPHHRESPVKASYLWSGANASMHAADAAGGSAAVVNPADLLPVPPATIAAEAARHGPALVPLSGILSPEDPTLPCILLQLCFCLRPEDKPAFAQLGGGRQQWQWGGGHCSAGPGPGASAAGRAAAAVEWWKAGWGGADAEPSARAGGCTAWWGGGWPHHCRRRRGCGRGRGRCLPAGQD